MMHRVRVSRNQVSVGKNEKVHGLPNIGFSEFDFYDLYRSTFEKSELGRMKKLLPLHALAENFGLVIKSLRPI